MKKVFIKLAAMSVLALCSSCIDNDYDMNNISDDMGLNDISLPAPIGKIEYDISDILEKSGVDRKYLEIVNNDIYIIYKDSLELESDNRIYINEIKNLPSRSFAASNASKRFVLDVEYPLTIGGGGSNTRVDSLVLIDTEIEIKVTSKLSAAENLKVILPDNLKAADTGKTSFEIKKGVTTQKIKIKDYSTLKLKAETINSKTSYSFEFQYILETSTTQNIKDGDVTVSLNVNNLEVDVIWGFLGDTSFEEKNKGLYISVFKETLPGSKLLFSFPTIECEVRNHVGFPAEFNIDYIRAFDSKKNNEGVYAAFGNGTKSYMLDLEKSPKPHSYSVKKQTFDRNNGNIHKLFEVEPDSITYSFKTNPKIQAGGKHFIAGNKYIDVIYEARLPLTFDKGSTLIIEDTLLLDLTIAELSEKIKNLELRFNYESMLPVSYEVRIVLLDENKNKIKNIKEHTFFVKSALVNSNGDADKTASGTLKMEFNEKEWQDVHKTKHIGLKVATVKNEDRINFRPNNYMKFNIDSYLEGNIKF